MGGEPVSPPLPSKEHFLKCPFSRPKLIITVIAAINEFERANLLERQREGIAIAKRQGKYKGRKPTTVPDLSRHYDRYQRREISKAALARELGISRPTLDKMFTAYQK